MQSNELMSNTGKNNLRWESSWLKLWPRQAPLPSVKEEGLEKFVPWSRSSLWRHQLRSKSFYPPNYYLGTGDPVYARKETLLPVWVWHFPSHKSGQVKVFFFLSKTFVVTWFFSAPIKTLFVSGHSGEKADLTRATSLPQNNPLLASSPFLHADISLVPFFAQNPNSLICRKRAWDEERRARIEIPPSSEFPPRPGKNLATQPDKFNHVLQGLRATLLTLICAIWLI